MTVSFFPYTPSPAEIVKYRLLYIIYILYNIYNKISFHTSCFANFLTVNCQLSAHSLKRKMDLQNSAHFFSLIINAFPLLILYNSDIACRMLKLCNANERKCENGKNVKTKCSSVRIRRISAVSVSLHTASRLTKQRLPPHETTPPASRNNAHRLTRKRKHKE